VLGICIGCIIAKTNIHVCKAGNYVPTYLWHLYEMLNMMFQHSGTVCALFHACLYARFITIKESTSSYLADQAMRICVQNQLCFIP